MKTQAIILFILLPFLFISSGCSRKQMEDKPNIIFLLADDHRWDALGAMGNEIIETPNLDNLAANGIIFDNAYVTTSICCCSRSSILTGQYVSRHGINSFQKDMSDEQVAETWPVLLKKYAGYHTGFVGKYGIGLEKHPSAEYDYWTCEKVYQPHYENKDAEGNYLHYTDKVQSDILNFLDIYSDSGSFCLSVSFKAPHVEDSDPRQFIYNPKYKNLYADTEIPVPETAAPKYWKHFPEDFQNNNEARRRWEMRFSTPEKYQESVKGYYRLIKGIDDAVGAIQKKLNEKGIADNTIIIYMGDNGFYLAEHGLAGKWYPHEESIRVPFIISNPGFKSSEKGKHLQEIALNIDVAPTILALADVSIPQTMQGENVLELLNQENTSWRKDFFYEHTIEIPVIPKSYAVVSQDYKYIEYPELPSGFREFYDLRKDPLEKENLINAKEYSGIISGLHARLDSMKNAVK